MNDEEEEVVVSKMGYRINGLYGLTIVDKIGWKKRKENLSVSSLLIDNMVFFFFLTCSFYLHFFLNIGKIFFNAYTTSLIFFFN